MISYSRPWSRSVCYVQVSVNRQLLTGGLSPLQHPETGEVRNRQKTKRNQRTRHVVHDSLSVSFPVNIPKDFPQGNCSPPCETERQLLNVAGVRVIKL